MPYQSTRRPATSTFEDVLKQCPDPFRIALIAVTDTAYMVDLWFKSRQIDASAADVVEMTRMVLAYEDTEK